MGAEVFFFIQKKENNIEGWKDVALYTKDEFVDIVYCGYDTYNYIKENWGMHIMSSEIDEIAKEHGWGDIEDTPYYAATLAKIKYYAVKEPKTELEEDIQNFYKRLYDEISAYIDFAGDSYIDIDNIRIIALVSY